jgi:hypothetical protein
MKLIWPAAISSRVAQDLHVSCARLGDARAYVSGVENSPSSSTPLRQQRLDPLVTQLAAMRLEATAMASIARRPEVLPCIRPSRPRVDVHTPVRAAQAGRLHLSRRLAAAVGGRLIRTPNGCKILKTTGHGGQKAQMMETSRISASR